MTLKRFVCPDCGRAGADDPASPLAPGLCPRCFDARLRRALLKAGSSRATLTVTPADLDMAGVAPVRGTEVVDAFLDALAASGCDRARVAPLVWALAASLGLGAGCPE